MATMKMSELVERYLDAYRDRVKDATFDDVASILRRLAREWDKNRRVPSSISEDWLFDFLRQYRRGGAGGYGRPLAPSTYNLGVNRVRAFVEFLTRRGVAHPFVLDACRNVPPGDPKDFLRITAAQMVYMIQSTEDPWERWVLAMASQTLGRDSELRNRDVSHLHLDRGTLDWYRRKTSDSDEMPITKPFREEWERWAYVYQESCGSIQRPWRLIPQRIRLGSFAHREWRYTPGESPKNLIEVVKKHVCRVTGMSREELKGQAVHIIRRSMARALYERLIAEGIAEPVALNRVQTLLGHGSPKITMRYISVQPDREERNRLLAGSELLWSPQDNVVPLRAIELG